jgi:hypothetical protein
MLQKTPAEQEHGLSSIIRTFDPDVPGYVFWLVMLMLITFPSAGAARQIGRSRDDALQALRVFVNDLQKARRFYESVPGLQMKREWEGPRGAIAVPEREDG